MSESQALLNSSISKNGGQYLGECDGDDESWPPLERTSALADHAFNQEPIVTEFNGQRWQNLYESSKVSCDDGLSPQEAVDNLSKYGPNLITGEGGRPFYKLFIIQLFSFVPVMVVVSGILKIIIRNDAGAILFIGVSLFFVVVATCGEYSSQEGLSHLQDKKDLHAIVLRGGEWIEVQVQDLTVGDRIRIKTGDIVPADLRVVQTESLLVNELNITGECFDIPKTTSKALPAVTVSTNTFPSDICISTTMVSGGDAECIVFAIGMDTHVGGIALTLGKPDMNKSPIQRAIDWLGLYCLIIFFILGPVTFFGFYLTETVTPGTCGEGDVECLVMFALSYTLVVIPAIMPNMLIAVVSAAFYMSTIRLRKTNCIMQKVTAVDTIACTTVICSDKTGTLTCGKMTAECLAFFRSSTPQLTFYPQRGPDPNGSVFSSGELTEGVRTYLDSTFQPNCVARQDFPGCQLQQYGAKDDQHVELFMTAAQLSCHRTKLKFDQAWECDGNMTECAMVVAAYKSGLVEAPELYPRVYEVPFLSQRKMSATVHRIDGRFTGLQFGPDITHVAIVKGAPDRMWDQLTAVVGDNLAIETRPGVLAEVQQEHENMTSKSLRVLMVAIRPMTTEEFEAHRHDHDDMINFTMSKPWPRSQVVQAQADNPPKILQGDASTSQDLSQINKDQSQYSNRLTQENSYGLILVGMIGLVDPIRVGVTESIGAIRGAGIRTVIITGDDPGTATAIGHQAGVLFPGLLTNKVRLASDLRDEKNKNKPSEVIREMTHSTAIWARASPQDKLTIVRSLQDQGHHVTMVGDGVNDASAIHKADVGVSLEGGADVARGEADIVLKDDDLPDLVSAIREGRNLFDIIQKLALVYIALRGCVVLTPLVCVWMGIPPPLIECTLRLSWFLCDNFVVFSFLFNAADPTLMHKPPRKRFRNIITKNQFLHSALPFMIYGAILLLASFCIGLKWHTGHWVVSNNGIFAVSSSNWADYATSDASKDTTCLFAGQMINGKYIGDKNPFFCRCQDRVQWALDHPEEVGFFGQSTGYAKWEGIEDDRYTYLKSPFSESNLPLVECNEKICWRDPSVRYNLPCSHCMTWALRKAWSMTSITLIVISNSKFWTCAYGKDRLRFRGPWLLILMTVGSVLCGIGFLRLEWFNKIADTAPLDLQELLVALLLGLVIYPLEELNKLLYRKRRRGRDKIDRARAELSAQGRIMST